MPLERYNEIAHDAIRKRTLVPLWRLPINKKRKMTMGRKAYLPAGIEYSEPTAVPAATRTNIKPRLRG
jgi:hypothetical protein